MLNPGAALCGVCAVIPQARRWALIVGASMVAAGLCGCLSLAPANAVPKPPVDERYPADTNSGPDSEGIDAASMDWRDYFVDPQLRIIVDAALANSRDLRVAALRIEEARANYGVQRSTQWPAISLGAASVRARLPGSALTANQALILGEYQVSIGETAWELDLWGRVRNLKEAALESYLASNEARRATTISLVAQVADAYLGLRELDERRTLAQQTVASREETYRIFRRRYEVGSASKLELVQVETLLTQAQTLNAQLEQQRAMQAHALMALVGAPVELPSFGTHPLDDRFIFGELRAGLPADLLLQRPDIAAAEHQLKGANANIGAARAAFFPRVTLTSQLGTSSTGLDGLFDAATRSWIFAPQISMPIFDGGRNRNNLDLAKARSDLAVANYEKTVQTAFREVADALSARSWLGEQLRIQQTLLDAENERARLARLRYDNGAATFLEVLDAQRDLLSAQQQRVQLQRALLSSRVSLYAALGGGTRATGARSLTSKLGETP